MSQRYVAIIALGLSAFLGISRASAGDWTISDGGTYNISAAIADPTIKISAGEGIIIDGANDTNPVTIVIDSGTVPALGKADKPAISITAAVSVVIQFAGNNLRLGHEDGTTLRISDSGGSLSADNSGYFDFTANTNKMLTVRGAVSGGIFRIGNNQIRVEGPFVGSISEIQLGGSAATLTVPVSLPTATVNNINLTGNATFEIADGSTLNTIKLDLRGYAATLTQKGIITNIDMSYNVSSTSSIIVNGQSPVTINTLTMSANGIINVMGGKQLTTTNPIGVGTNTLTMTGAGTISHVALDSDSSRLNVNESGTITTLDFVANATIDLQANLTVTNDWCIGARTLNLRGNGRLNKTCFNNDSSRIVVRDSPTITRIDYVGNVNAEINVYYGQLLTVDPNKLYGGIRIPDGKTLILSGQGSVSYVEQTNAGTTLKVTNDAGVESLVTGGNDFTIDVSAGRTLTLGMAVSVGSNTLTLSGSGTVSDVNLNSNYSILTSSGAATPIVSTLLVNANGKVILLDGKKITVTNPFSVGPNTFTLQGSKGGVQDSFAATIRLNNIASQLIIDSTDIDNIKDYTISVEVDGIILAFTVNSSPTAINMSSGRGDLHLTVALNKLLNTVIDVNRNILALYGPGRIKTIKLDEDGGGIDIHETTIVETIQHSAESVITFTDNGKILTITNAIEVGADTLEIAGSSGGTAEYVNGTIKLQKTASILKFSGKDEDNISGSTIVVEANEATINTAISIKPIAINMTTDVGNLNLYIAANKYLDTKVTVNNNTLTLWNKGTLATIEMNKNGGALTVRENTIVENINLGGKVTIDVFQLKTLTTDLDVKNLELTLAGTGTITKIMTTTGKIIANAASIINELNASPGTNQTFTWSGTGAATVKVLTPFNENSESLTKTGTGSLRVSGGFSFANANGVKLLVNEGTFIDAGGASIVFGDNDERIVVANGATYTTSSSLTGHSGPAVNMDAVAGSTVNFAKTGEQVLFAGANDDFRLLGTVNIENGAIVRLTGAYRYLFGNINVRTSGELINNTPGSTMHFTPGSMLTLEGTGSGALRVNGQSDTNPIIMNTTTGTGKFTFNRRRSDKVTFYYVDLTNCTYASLDGGLAVDELDLVGIVDNGNNVNWFSDLSVNAGPDKTILSGDSVTLQGSVYGASGTYTYSWSPVTGLDDPNVRDPKASPTATQVYTLTVTDAVDTSIFSSDTVTVTVLPQLSVNAGPDKTVAKGTNVQLQGSVSGGSGQYTYEWVPNNYLSDPASPTPICTPLQTLTYTFSVTDTVVQKTVSDAVTITVSDDGNGGTGGLCGAIGGTSLMLTFMGFVGLRHARRRGR